MINDLTTHESAVGPLQLHHKSGGVLFATIEFQLTMPTTASLILLDELGRATFNGRYELTSGTTELELHLPNLPGGTYNAWIEINDRTFIRQMSIEQETEPPLLSRFKSLFVF